MISWTLIELEGVDSTQAIARDLASQGAPEGTVVAAESQSSGKGRMGRPWASPAGGLYMSFILRPDTLPRPELAALVSALGVVGGVAESTGLSTEVRWPNDVMARGKKLAGVIAEAESSGSAVTQLVIGVGVNCNAPISGAPFSSEATSLAEELNGPVAVADVRSSILRSFSALYERWRKGDDMIQTWKSRVGTLGRRISVKLKTEETAFSATATGIDPSGDLRASRGGRSVTIRAQDLEWLKEER